MKKAFLLEKMRIKVRDVPKPRLDPDHVLLKVQACFICGTDLHSYRYGENEIMKRVPENFPMNSFYGAINRQGGGHQIAGEIVELGADVTQWKIGDRVAGVGRSGFAEYCSMKRIYPLPKDLSYEIGSFLEPLGVAVAAVRRSRLRLGDFAIVLGAGPIGHLTLQCAKTAGGTVYVTEVSKKRIKLAEMFADEVINPREDDPVQRINELMDGVAPNVIFECAGRDATMKQLIEMAGKYWTPYGQHSRGVIVSLFEKPWIYDLFDNNAIIAKSMELISSPTYYPYEHPKDELRIAIDLMKTGKINVTPLITTKVSLANIDLAFKALLKGEELGIVIHP
jgi:(R,R)-butanediol dehydrogenase/meso-butanediol dehydrogenase/diacetyl reductase